jgi:hypothetical protein
MINREEDAKLATVEAMLAAEGMNEAAELLREAEAEITETGYDNWNGGTRIHTVFLTIEPSEFGRLSAKRSSLEEQITARVKSVFEDGSNDWFSVEIRPRIQARSDWRSSPGRLSRRARQNIIDGLKVEKVQWMGELDDVEFLQRLWDLESMPSTDHRFENAAGDIWQHRRNNDDWDDDWIFADPRTCSWLSLQRWFTRLLGPIGTKRWKWSDSSTTNCTLRVGRWSKWKRLRGGRALLPNPSAISAKDQCCAQRLSLTLSMQDG